MSILFQALALVIALMAPTLHAQSIYERDPALPRPRVLCIYTGGTIGMRKNADGEFEPASGYLEYVIRSTPNFNANDMPLYEILEYDPLLDSSNMKPSDWLKIAKTVQDKYDEYDGFVVIHGTDTMAYTASALSFLLHDLRKSVVVTGSQIPLAESFNDGLFNLVGAIYMAGAYSIPEVTLFFNGKLMRGNRCQKFSAWEIDGFDSATHGILAKYGASLVVNDDAILPYPTKPFSASTSMAEDVTIIYLYPGLTGQDVRQMTHQKRGIVILAYGSGNGPSLDQDFLDALTERHEAGAVIVDATQTHWGMVDLGLYETGGAMRRAGAVSAYTMTAESCLAKLSYLLAQNLSQAEVEARFQKNMVGELDLPGGAVSFAK